MPPIRFQELAEMRRSQVVTTFGPGAIVDFRAGGKGGAPISVVAAGLEAWDESAGQDGQSGLNHPQVIKEPRLQDILKVDGFRLPPAVPTDNDGYYLNNQRLVGVRFPQWLQCPGCSIIQSADGWNADPSDPALYCEACSHGSARRLHVVPVRFITTCRNGHLDEFPWHIWVKHKGNCTNNGGPLQLIATGPGLAGLVLKCLECGHARPLDGCFGRKALEGLKCRGQRHWLGDRESCTEQPQVLLRGATNVYFPVIVSALDIPPWANQFHKRISPLDWARLKAAATDEKRSAIIIANDLNVVHGLTPQQMLAEVNLSLKTLESNNADTLRYDEYRQLTSGGASAGTPESEFEIQPEPVPPELAGFVSKLVRVTRLREVRVLRAFTRLKPPADWRENAGDIIPFVPISKERKNWLPAIEVRGEGIFLELNRDTVEGWLSSPAANEIKKRADKVNQAYVEDYRERNSGQDPPQKISPRLLLVHSFAHVLIRQMSLDCGYSTASLRERIYVNEGDRDMCGLLVYTASADADGTLGGLCRQAKPDRFIPLVLRAIRSSAWCSSDPLCIEGVQSASEALNLAACHSCMLLPETSCEQFNRLLDRAMLVGLPQPADGSEPWRADVGFFKAMLAGTGGS